VLLYLNAEEKICVFRSFDRPSVEAVCLPGTCILRGTLMSHAAIEKRKSSNKSGKIQIGGWGGNKGMLVKLGTFIEHLRRNSKTQISA